MKKLTENIMVKLTLEDKQRLAYLASQRGIQTSSFVRVVLKQYLRDSAPEAVRSA